VPFPMFADAEANASFSSTTTDHSYPANYGRARENFVREAPPRQGSGVRKFMSLHDGAGQGLLHTQSAEECSGRKYWVWGTDPSDVGRMRFLSSPGDGDYIEMQAGPAPTQSNTFPMGPASVHEWTESFGPLDVSAPSVSGPYDEAVASVRAFLDAGEASEIAFKDADAFLKAQADRPPSRVLYRGSAYGALHEQLLRQSAQQSDPQPTSSRPPPFASSPGLDFGTLEEALAADPTARPWASLLVNGTFGAAALSAVVQSFMVDDAWVLLMERALSTAGSGRGGGGGGGGGGSSSHDAWLLHLHLGIAAHHRSNLAAAAAHYNASIAAKPSALALRNRAHVALARGDVSRALADYMKGWQIAVDAATHGEHPEPESCPPPSGGPPPRPGGARDACPTASFARHLAAEICEVLVSNSLWDWLESWVDGLPPATAPHGAQTAAGRSAPSRLATALDRLENLGIARAHLQMRGKQTDPKRTVAFLSAFNGASTTGLTGGLPQLWNDAHYAIEAQRIGRPLTIVDRLHVRHAFPVPPNINFAGAT
jgi:hypothetical protein